ncbi:aromatic ring-hydroxylating oxygenase subunit alpha [Bdellovibrio sp. HCB2-146]|uniref:aromatic ring-hydroxylating oxygenase subunit alpha n=1 Tax=Bdellovibrio sp. HCB2-146 TaxID=3394362 RepID=UPI0039BCCD00
MRTLKQIREITLEHMKNETVELGEKVTSIALADYRDSTLFQRELEVIRKRPLPFVASDKIKKTGDVFAGELAGVPIVAVRNEQDIRVFINTCRHRGALLASEGTKKDCQKLVCPFHGWSYSLEGELLEVPSSHQCFSKHTTSAFRLQELKSYEKAGMIWVVLSPHSQENIFEESFHQLHKDSDEIGLNPQHAMPEMSFLAPFNWKVGVEAFLEVYHFAHAHAPYLSQLQFPNLSLADSYNENCRIVVPLKQPAGEIPVLGWAQVMYFIFPSSFLLFYDDHVALISLVPQTTGETKFRYTPIVPREADLKNEKIQQRVEFLKIILGQDIAILEGVQKGLDANRNGKFVFTRLEQILEKFHQDLHSNASAKSHPTS